MFESTKSTLLRSSKYYCFGVALDEAVVGLDDCISDSLLLDGCFAGYCDEASAGVTSLGGKDAFLNGSSSKGPFSGDCAA